MVNKSITESQTQSITMQRNKIIVVHEATINKNTTESYQSTAEVINNNTTESQIEITEITAKQI